MVAPGTINVWLDWDDTSAKLTLFLTDPNGAQVSAVTDDGQAEDHRLQRHRFRHVQDRREGAHRRRQLHGHRQLPGQRTPRHRAWSTFQKAIGFSGPAGLYAYGMDWDSTDNTILVGDYWNYRVWRYTTDGTLVGSVSQHALGGLHGGITAPYDVEADPTDLNSSGKAALWVADQGSSRIVEFDHNGKWLQTIGKMNAGQATGTDAQHPGHSYGQGCGNGQMQIPTHILVDTVFSTHYIYVSDPRCRDVYIFDHQGGFHGRARLDRLGRGHADPARRRRGRGRQHLGGRVQQPQDLRVQPADATRSSARSARRPT